MAAAVTTKTAKDGASSPATFPMAFLDISGTGAGPFVPLHALYDSAGTLINPATKEGVAAIVTALAGTLSVAAQSLPLPAGAATDAKLEAMRALLAGTLGISAAALPLPTGAATDAKVEAVRALLAATLTVSGSVTVGNLPATQAVSAAALPLPSGAATAAAQGTGNTALTSIDTKTPALASGRVPVDGSGVTQPVSAASLPLPAGAATGAKQDAIVTAMSLLAAAAQLPASLGAKASAASLSMAPATDAVFPAPADQDPIFDHANGKKVSVQTSTLVLTPAAGCKYIRISCDADVMVNTAGAPAVDDGTSIRLVANSPEVIPVVAGTAVNALSLSGAAAVVRATPMKVRT